MAAAVALAAALGLAIALLPFAAVIGVVVIGASLGGLVVARAVLRPSGGGRPVAQVEPAGDEDILVRGARALFFAGSATIGLITIRPALGLTASDLFFFASLGAVGLAALTARLRYDYALPRSLTIGVLLFAFGGFISSYGAVEQGQSVGIVIRLLYLTLVWFWLATVVLRTGRHVRIAAMLWVVGAAVSAGGAILQLVYGDVIEGGEIRFGRMTGFTDHFNNLGGLVATAFVPALMLAVDSERRATRLLAGGCLGLLGAGLLLSGSVGGLLATAVAVVFWLAIRGLTVRTLLIFGAVFATGFVVLGVTGTTDAQSPLERITRVTSREHAEQGTGGSIYSRFDGYSAAWARIGENPVVGVGLDIPSGEVYLEDKAVHNIILNPWFAAGIFGLIGVLLLICGAAATGIRAVRGSGRHERSFTAALLASVVAFVVFGLGQPILFVRYGWFPTALLVALVVQRSRVAHPARRRVRAPTPVVRPTLGAR